MWFISVCIEYFIIFKIIKHMLLDLFLNFQLKKFQLMAKI